MKRFGINLKNVATIVACFAAFTFVACGTSGDPEPKPEKEVPVASVTIVQPSESALSELYPGGKTVTLTVKIEPDNATDKTVTWSSSNNAIATVDNSGVVTGVSQGKATISATTKSGNKKADCEIEVKSKPQPVELKSPITVNTTLKDLGMDIDYFYAGNDQLIVENNATLTIESGVTIQFTNAGRRGGIIIKANSTIKAVGTSSKRIQFIGTDNNKGAWGGINLESTTDNRFDYCDFLNAGCFDQMDAGALYLTRGAKVGITYCKFTNGNGGGLGIHNYGGDCQLSAFNNNVFEDFELPPVYFSTCDLKQLDKFDMTSDLTKNKRPFIQIDGPSITEDVTINQTTVPYYLINSIYYINYKLTINEGVTFYIADGVSFNAGSTHTGRLMINGTAAKKVKFTRFPGSPQYWGGIHFTMPGSIINHCIFEYGGSIATMDGILDIRSKADLTLNNVEINNSKNYGVLLMYDAVVKPTNVTFSNNPKGNIFFTNNKAPITSVLPNFP